MGRGKRARNWMERHRYALLCAVTGLFLIIMPYAAVSAVYLISFETLVVFGVVVLRVYSPREGFAWVLYAAWFLVLASHPSLMRIYAPEVALPAAEVVHLVLTSAFLFWLAVRTLLRHVLRRGPVRLAVFAGVAAYLLLALAWAPLYLAAERLPSGLACARPAPVRLEVTCPDSTTHVRVASQADASVRPGHRSVLTTERVVEAVYLSLGNISGLGYGDVPLLDASQRLLAALEAVLGQVYMALAIGFVVARYYELRLRQAAGDREGEPGG
jgi:hypothetical protein